MDLKNRLQQEANVLQAAELQRKRADYLLRMAKGPLAAKVIAQQKEKIKELEEQLRIVTASMLDRGTFDGTDVGSNPTEAGDRA